MKKKDIIVITLVLLAALALYGATILLRDPAVSQVVVKVDGKEVLRAPLETDGQYDIPLPDGDVNVVGVEGGAAYMVEANCRDGLCVNQGKTRNSAKEIVCLPHRVVISLVSNTQQAPGELDVVLY